MKNQINTDMNKYPIYIISKGRWDRISTVKTLKKMNVSFKIVVEPKEYNNYSLVINKKNILVLPHNFSEFGKGSIPVRNWVFMHSKKNGYKWHWILDDNIESIERYNNNLKIKCISSKPFEIIEDFVLRYENLDLCGMNYSIFCPYNEGREPLIFNTRIYSCILIKNSIPERWRGKYNEDTDLSLRVLKRGNCTVLFNTFLIGKRATLTQKGGNEDIYNKSDNRKKFAESLQKQHPDVVKVVWRYNRWHHQVNYKPFKKNKLIFKKNYNLKKQINNFNLKLIKL